VFDDPATLDTVISTGFIRYSKQFLADGRHLFSIGERAKVEVLVVEALKLINRTDPRLYECIRSAVGSIVMLKSEEREYLAGSTRGLIGLIWLDPSVGGEWSVVSTAEQIVHEFIHIALSTAELLHGMYRELNLASSILVKSAIRKQLRGYDRGIHAAYVATGLVIFHSKAGYRWRALELMQNLPDAIADLEKMQVRTGILTPSGQTMLEHLSKLAGCSF